MERFISQHLSYLLTPEQEPRTHRQNSERSVLRQNMRQTAIGYVFLINFLLACFMVDMSHQVLNVLTHHKNSGHGSKHKEATIEPGSGESIDREGSQQPQAKVRPRPFRLRRPDRFPEGPMQDHVQRSRFHYY